MTCGKEAKFNHFRLNSAQAEMESCPCIKNNAKEMEGISQRSRDL